MPIEGRIFPNRLMRDARTLEPAPEAALRRAGRDCPERFGAERARALGLVHEVCATGALDEAAAPVIDGLLMTAPDALAQTKSQIREDAGLAPVHEYRDALIDVHARKRQSAEAAEGLASFREKRKPAWYPG